MADLIVKSNVKEYSDMNVSADFYEALDDRVDEILARACERARANDRKTLRPSDL